LVNFLDWRELRGRALGLAGVAFALMVASDAADARGHLHLTKKAAAARRAEAAYSPPSASIIVDGNTGEVLHAFDADGLRHPASLTKIMTLYLLFERLESGAIKLDTPLMLSAHAAAQAPSKLGIKAGQAMPVDQAIKAVVTKSANDIAVAIAENLAGDEKEFAKLMTLKAHALGMSRTTYVNASGLPDDDQITTAHDQALLGRAIEDRFPRYYPYFATREFVYHGVAMRNHNHLLGSVDGVDGIKTGYTQESGFNLVTSVHRDGHYIIGVVLGGRSAFERDANMRELIDGHIRQAGLWRTAPLIAENAEASEPSAADTKTSVGADRLPAPRASDPIQPVLVKTIPFGTASAQAPSPARKPGTVRITVPSPSPTAAPGRHAKRDGVDTAQVASADAGLATDPIKVEIQKLGSTKMQPADMAPPNNVALTRTAPRKVETGQSRLAIAEQTTPQTRAGSGWLIQIGAFQSEDEAKAHLSAAKVKASTSLAAAHAFIEPVQKSNKAFYRARFAGLDKEAAEAACRQLKHSDIVCIALKK
jgi:D-alanyl-D-alanine carboxypeptidase